MDQKFGKLIVSTRSAAAGRKTAILVSSVFLYLLAIVMLFCEEAFTEALGRGTGEIVWIVAIAFLIGWPTFQLVTAFMGSRSYCDVYEHGVAGTTGLSAANPNSPMQNFELGYDEIVNVTESGKTLFIYTQYAVLEILALKNRTEAAQEIRKRMTGRK